MSFRFDIITLFPELVEGYLSGSMLGRAQSAGIIEVGYTNPRDFTEDRHRSVDDAPFGGGAGMVMMPEPLCRAVEDVRTKQSPERVVLLSPAGTKLTQSHVQRFAGYSGLALVCGRYEGVDERVAEHVIDEEVSVGDYVLTGGELGAMIMVDAISRMLDGVLGNPDGSSEESFTHSPLLEYPQYTRPRQWRGHDVPPILLTGDHAAIKAWRQKERVERTRSRRPDLFELFENTEKSDEIA